MPDNGDSRTFRNALTSDSMGDPRSFVEDMVQKRRVQVLKSLAFALFVAYTGAFGATIAGMLIQGIQEMLVISVASILLVLSLIGVFRFIKQGKLETAAYLLLIITVTHIFVVHVVLSGLFTIVVLSGVVLIFVLGTLVLRGRWRLLLTIAVVFVALCVLIELFIPFSRFNITSMPLADPARIVVAGILLLVLIALSIRSAQDSPIRTRLLVSFVVATIIPGLLTVGVIMIDAAIGGEHIKSAMSAAWLSIAMTTITIFLALIGAMFFSRGISRPLNEMIVMAATVSEGDLSAEVHVDRIDEIGRTAIAFNRMTNQLRSVIEDLEEGVSARTVDLQQRTVQLETAARVSRQIAAVREVDVLIEVAVDEIARQFGFDYVAIYLLDDQRQTLRLRAVSPGIGETLLARGYKLDMGKALVAAVAVKGSSLIVFDYNTNEQYVGLPKLPHIHSEMALPLRIRDEVIGVLDLTSTQPANFTQQDATYLQTMADQIALAIDNAILLASADERLREIERLITSQSIEGWQTLVSQRKNWGYVYDGSSVRPSQQQTFSRDDVDLVIALRSDRSELGNIKLKLPENQTLSDDVVDLAGAIANEAGHALESARLYTETQNALQEVGALYRAIQAVVAVNTPEEVLNAFVNNLVAPGIDRCVLLIKMYAGADPERKFARIEAAWDAGMESSPAVDQVWDMRQIPAISSDVLVVADTESSTELDRLSKSTLIENGIRALMVVPLRAGEDIFGWLMISALHSHYTFTERQIRLYSNFADQLSQALENIRLVQATKKRALEERLVREATERMREPVEINDVLNVAAEEMRLILDLDDLVIRLTLPESD